MTVPSWGRVCLVLLVAGLAACEQERPPLGAPVCVGYKRTIGPLLVQRCGDCHASQAPAGGVVLDDYVRALEQTRGAQPALLRVFDSDETHRALSDVRPAIEQWIAACDTAFLQTALHARGIMDPESDDFHGALLRSSGYDFENCQRCHGDDYRGGGSEAACTDCHENGPTDCATCHGDEQRSGAHDAHAAGSVLKRPTGCDACHVVPEDALDPGHFRQAAGIIDPPPAEVVMTGSAAWGRPDREAPVETARPTYDGATQTCSDVYCHGGRFDDPAATLVTPAWTAGGNLDCTSCHGSPPADHESDRCGDCHGAVSPARETLVSTSLHLDGRIQFGVNDDCGHCHGGVDGAPGPDLDGLTTSSTVTVGAHEAHLRPRLGLANPLTCAECHLEPEEVTSVGHIDSARPAEVFTPSSGPIARADNAQPTWDRSEQTCSNTYCHGGGEGLGRDQWPDKVPVVRWTGFATGQVFCGSCHGLPPTVGPHFDFMTINDCATCHPRSVDAFGNILFVDGATPHMDGTANFLDGDDR